MASSLVQHSVVHEKPQDPAGPMRCQQRAERGLEMAVEGALNAAGYSSKDCQLNLCLHSFISAGKVGPLITPTQPHGFTPLESESYDDGLQKASVIGLTFLQTNYLRLNPGFSGTIIDQRDSGGEGGGLLRVRVRARVSRESGHRPNPLGQRSILYYLVSLNCC